MERDEIHTPPRNDKLYFKLRFLNMITILQNFLSLESWIISPKKILLYFCHTLFSFLLTKNSYVNHIHWRFKSSLTGKGKYFPTQKMEIFPRLSSFNQLLISVTNKRHPFFCCISEYKLRPIHAQPRINCTGSNINSPLKAVAAHPSICR